MAAAAAGDRQAAEELLPLVYEQLRAVARRRMAQERADHTLQATALVHEAYVRLLGDAGTGDDVNAARWANRAHFFHAAAQSMRRILIEHARGRGRDKRGGKRGRVPLDVLDLAEDGHPDDILALDEALQRLEQEEPQVAAVVRLRFFAGLTVEEAAAALGVASKTVSRDWAYARAWLYKALGEERAS